VLERLLALEAFSYFLVFTRLGATVMLMPGVGEGYVPVRVRLLFALVVTAVMQPVVAPLLPEIPESFLALFILLIGEAMVGVFIGTVARVLVSALITTGTVVAFLTGFANAVLFNPMLQDQGAMTAVFLSLLGTLLIFVTNLHHLMFMAMMDSYTMFVPGAALPLDDFAEVFARMVSTSFKIGVQLAAPFILVTTLFYISLGLLARLMPQFQVFFVGLPLQIMLGLIVLLVTISSIMMGFLDYFAVGMNRLIQAN
jgi:flagellar biosynthetic protein FliR